MSEVRFALQRALWGWSVYRFNGDHRTRVSPNGMTKDEARRFRLQKEKELDA